MGLGMENVKRHIAAIKWIGVSFILAITLATPILMLAGILTMDRGEQHLDYDINQMKNSTSCNYSNTYDIGERVYLTVCSLNGEVLMDIRRFVNYTATIAGIPLNLDQWTSLKRQIHSVDSAIREAQPLYGRRDTIG